MAEAISLGRGPGNFVLGVSWTNFWTLENFAYLGELLLDHQSDGRGDFLREGSWKFCTWGQLDQFLDFRKFCLSWGTASRPPNRIAEAISLGRGPGNFVPGVSLTNFWTLEKIAYLGELHLDHPIGSPRRFP